MGHFTCAAILGGGTMAYLVAQQLRAAGLPIMFLALFDTNYYRFNRQLPFFRRGWLLFSNFMRMSLAEKVERLGRVWHRYYSKTARRIESMVPQAWLPQERIYERIIRAEGQKDRIAIMNYTPEPFDGKYDSLPVH